MKNADTSRATMPTDAEARDRASVASRPTEADDAELAARAAVGDVDAVATLYDRHAPVLLALAVRLVRDRGDAEDVVHDAFLSMPRRAGLYSAERGTVGSWLIALVRNLSIDRIRRRTVRALFFERIASEASTDDPEALLVAAMGRARVRRALATLSTVQRRTLEVAFFEGLTYAEIARREELPVGTVKSRAARALASLGVALGEDARG